MLGEQLFRPRGIENYRLVSSFNGPWLTLRNCQLLTQRRLALSGLFEGCFILKRFLFRFGTFIVQITIYRCRTRACCFCNLALRQSFCRKLFVGFLASLNGKSKTIRRNESEAQIALGKPFCCHYDINCYPS